MILSHKEPAMTKMPEDEFNLTMTKIRELYNKTGNKGFMIEGIYWCHNTGSPIPEDFLSIIVESIVSYRIKTNHALGHPLLRTSSYEDDKKTTLDKCFGINKKKMQTVFSEKPDYIEMINLRRLIFGLNIKQAAHVVWKEIGYLFKHKESTIYDEYVREFPDQEFSKYLVMYGSNRGNNNLKYYLEGYPPEIQSYIKRYQTIYPKE
jgi:hypothetical protein